MLAFNGRAKFRKFSRASKGTEGSSRKLREFETGRARRKGEVKTSRDLFLDGPSSLSSGMERSGEPPFVERCREGDDDE